MAITVSPGMVFIYCNKLVFVCPWYSTCFPELRTVFPRFSVFCEVTLSTFQAATEVCSCCFLAMFIVQVGWAVYTSAILLWETMKTAWKCHIQLTDKRCVEVAWCFMVLLSSWSTPNRRDRDPTAVTMIQHWSIVHHANRRISVLFRITSPRPSLLNYSHDTVINSPLQKPMDLKQLKQRAAAIPPIVSV